MKLEVTLEYERSTKNTHIYIARTNIENMPIQTLYIRKTSMPNPLKLIRVVVEEVR